MRTIPIAWAVTFTLIGLDLPAAGETTQAAGSPQQVTSAQTTARPGQVAPAVPRGDQGRGAMPRDGGPPLTGTAVLRGRVVQADGSPLAGVRVRAGIGRPGATPRAVLTDAQGRFELRDLPGMTLPIVASRQGYAGRGRNRGATDATKMVSLKNGETVEGVEIVMVRTGVIAGHVFRPDGEPLVGASVQPVAARRTSAGRQLGFSGPPDTTDDRGAFRLHSLPPGEYYLAVRPQGGRGDTAWEDADGGTQGIAPVFYPGTPDVSAARALTVESGGEITADMTAPLSPLFTISGVAVDAEGRAQPASVMLRSRRQAENDVLVNTGGRVLPDGSFTIERVPPGSYTLAARVHDRGPDPTSGAPYRPPPYGEADVDVNADIEGIVIRLTNGATVRGRVIFATAPPEDLSTVQILARPLDQRSPGGGGRPVALAVDGTFELEGVRGPITMAVMGGRASGDPLVRSTAQLTAGPAASPAPPPFMIGSLAGGVVGAGSNTASPASTTTVSGGAWRVRAIRVNGRDVTDEGLDAGREGTVTGVEVEVSRDFAAVEGVVRDESGKAFAGATILAIALEGGQRRPPMEGPAMPRGRSGDQGRYVAASLAPGTYDLLAVAEMDESMMDDDARAIERLRSRATRIVLVESQRLTLDLTLQRP